MATKKKAKAVAKKAAKKKVPAKKVAKAPIKPIRGNSALSPFNNGKWLIKRVTIGDAQVLSATSATDKSDVTIFGNITRLNEAIPKANQQWEGK